MTQFLLLFATVLFSRYIAYEIIVKPPLGCLRIKNNTDVPPHEFVDLCSTNPRIDSYWSVNTMQACAVRGHYRVRHFFLLYEGPEFQGPYLLIRPGSCVEIVKPNSTNHIDSLGSVGRCMLISTSQFGRLDRGRWECDMFPKHETPPLKKIILDSMNPGHDFTKDAIIIDNKN